MRSCALALVVMAVATAARAEEVDAARLRDVLRLPAVPLLLSWDEADGLRVPAVRPDPRQEITALRGSLKDAPDDADRWAALGRLYLEVGAVPEGRDALGRAVTVYRKRLSASPKDVALLLACGQALRAAGRWQDAETAFREAIEQAPDGWEAWAALGLLFQQRALDVLFRGPDRWTPAMPWREAFELAQDERFLRGGADDAEKFLTEASRCYAKAIAAAPKRGEAYFARGLFHFWERPVRLSIDLARGKEPKPLESLPPECLDDMRQALSLGLKDTRQLLKAVTFEAVAGWEEAGKAGDAAAGFESLPEKNQKRIRGVLDTLKATAEGDDRGRAVEAANALAILELSLLGDAAEAEKAARAALKLEPKNEAAWDVLVAAVADEKGPEECAGVLEERLKACETAHGRLLMAECCLRQDRLDDAAEQCRAAVKLTPDDFLANADLATLLLKKAESPEAMKEALEQIERTARLDAEGIFAEDHLHLDAVAGVARVAAGKREEGLRILEAIVAVDPRHEIAQQALKVLKK